MTDAPLRGSVQLARDEQFRDRIRAAAYRLTLNANPDQGGDPQAAARLALISRVIITPDPGTIDAMAWSIAAIPEVVTAWVNAQYNIDGIPDEVMLVAVEGAWRVMAALQAALVAATAPNLEDTTSGDGGTTPDSGEPTPPEPTP